MEKGAVSRSEFVVRARALDDQLECLIRDLPLEWLPRKAPAPEDDPNVLDDYYDVYPDHYTAQVINALRTMRLIIYKLFDQYVPDHDYLGEERLRDGIRDSTRRICASVPQFMLPWASPENSLPFSPVQLLRCSTFLTPLYFVNQVTEDPLIRQWVAWCMRFMWESGGLRAAKDIEDIVKTSPNLGYWTVFAMTGSYAFAA
ncbi:C6 transcription factor [Colletotrichum musicola]|uniref:C6 transcription factor n=1 Tax=Colletotrichum musicola TaxID=2175873 RepID=A0A8H6MNA2_9PEZI|nr:C6 transcription factor [Colletotrichum musicola]